MSGFLLPLRASSGAPGFRSGFVVFFGDNPEEILMHLRFQKALSEVRILQHSGDLRQRLEMLARRILGRHQQKKEMYGLSVHRLEGYPFPVSYTHLTLPTIYS